MTSMFDYDDTVNLAFDAKIAGKKLVTAKHELLTKTGDFLFLAHSDKELAQRMQMVEEDIEKVAYRKLANVSDSKAKLVRAVYEEWSIRHANCDFCKESSTKTAWGWNPISDLGQAISDVGSGAGKATKAVGNAAKDVAHAVGTGVGDAASGIGSAAQAAGNAVGTAAADVAHSTANQFDRARHDVAGAADAVGTAATDVAKGVAAPFAGAAAAAGSLISQFTKGVQGDKPSGASTPPAPSAPSSFRTPMPSANAAEGNMQFQKAPSATDPDNDNDPNDPNESNPNAKEGAARKIARLSYFLKESKDTNFTV